MSTRVVKPTRVRAESVFRQEGSLGSAVARVPKEVREKLSASYGDKLIWDEGCEAAVQRAALGGTYFVVRLEHAPQPVAQAESASAPLEAFEESVRRKLRGEE